MNRTPAPIIVPSVQRSPQAWSKEPVALWSETEWSNPGCAGLLTGHKLSLSNEPLSKNGDWNDFWNFYIDSERDRLSPVEYNRAA